MLVALIFGPLVLAGLAMLIPSDRWRPWLLPAGALAHLAGTVASVRSTPPAVFGGWLVLDAPGRLVLALVSVLFAICSFYAVGYLRHRPERPNRIFCACLLAFLAMMGLVICSHHLGLMWVAVEATTLATAPLLYFNCNSVSLEATWRYLLICSVGIALSLLGSFFLAYASIHSGLHSSLLLDDLLKVAPKLSAPWLHAAFVFLLVGYGTKMGLAPMHTWKPDAYGEAPGVVGALLAGGLTSCAFLTILRIYHICNAAGSGEHARKLLTVLGLLSMAVAAVFVLRQRDIKRMLAYSSVEHMGILALGVGIGGPAALFGALLHMVNNALTKGVLFLSAGNIHRAYGSKRVGDVGGAMRRVPLSASLLVVGLFAVTGSPPFGPFISEFTIVSAAFAGNRIVLAAFFLLLLVVIFIGMGRTVLSVVQGQPTPAAQSSAYRDGLLTGLPIVVLAVLILLLGLHIPSPLRTLLADAVKFLEV